MKKKEKDLVVRIERGIPMPPSRKTTEWGLLAGKMKKGDSIGLLPHYFALKLRGMLSSHGMRSSTRKMEDGSYRIWCCGPIEK